MLALCRGAGALPRCWRSAAVLAFGRGAGVRPRRWRSATALALGHGAGARPRRWRSAEALALGRGAGESIAKQHQLHSTSAPIEIQGGDFSNALQTVVSVHRQDIDVLQRVQKMSEWALTEYAILQIVWDHPNGITEDDTRKRMEPNYRQFFDKAIGRIEESEIFTRRSKMLFFSDPVLRLFVKFHLDEKKSADH